MSLPVSNHLNDMFLRTFHKALTDINRVSNAANLETLGKTSRELAKQLCDELFQLVQQEKDPSKAQEWVDTYKEMLNVTDEMTFDATSRLMLLSEQLQKRITKDYFEVIDKLIDTRLKTLLLNSVQINLILQRNMKLQEVELISKQCKNEEKTLSQESKKEFLNKQFAYYNEIQKLEIEIIQAIQGKSECCSFTKPRIDLINFKIESGKIFILR